MPLMYLRALVALIEFGYFLRRENFAALYDRVRTTSTHVRGCSRQDTDRVCSAIDHVCAFYSQEVLCLQRSAATVRLLRRYGADAKLVIGAQHTPFRSHAWVELDGTVLNDKPYVREMYEVLEIC